MHFTVSHPLLSGAVDRLLPIVPNRPLNPVEENIRIVVDTIEGGVAPDGQVERHYQLVLDATDGRIQARVVVPLSGEDHDGFDLFPAQRLHDFLDNMPAEDVTVFVQDRLAQIQTTTSTFTTPLPSDTAFPPFPEPEGDYQPLGTYDIGAFVAGLDRVTYAMGAEDAREDFRMVQILNGMMRAYSGYRAQEVQVASQVLNGMNEPIEDAEILLVDYAIQPLARFLKSSRTKEVLVVRTSEEVGGKYVFVLDDRSVFVVPVPGVKFTDMTNIFRLANEQTAEAGRVEVNRNELINAVKAARLQAPPDELVVSIDLREPILVHAMVDDSNRFERTIPNSAYDGEEDRTVSASIDDLLGLLGAWPHERATLLVAPAKFGRGQTMPMIVLRDEDSGSPGIIAQAK